MVYTGGTGCRCFKEFVVKRYGVNKSKSASKFKKHMSKTKAINVKAAPMRGGIRL